MKNFIVENNGRCDYPPGSPEHILEVKSAKMFLGDQEIKGVGSYELLVSDFFTDRHDIPPGRYVSADSGYFTVKAGKLYFDDGSILKEMPMVKDGFRYVPFGEVMP